MLQFNFVTSQVSVRAFIKERLQKSWLAILLLTFLMLITVSMEALMPRVMGWLLDDFKQGFSRQHLGWYALGAWVVYFGATLVYRYFFSVIAASDLYNFRLVLWNQYMKSNQSFNQPFHKSFFAALMQDAAACSSMFSTLFIQCVQIFFHTVAVASLMFLIHKPLALAFWLAIIVAVGITLLGNKKYARLVQLHRHKNATYLQATHQAGQDGRHLVDAGLEDFGQRNILAKMSSYLKIREVSAMKLVRIELLVHFIVYIGLAGSVAALIKLYGAGLITTGDALSFIFLATLAVAPVNQSTMLWASVQRLRVSLGRILSVEKQLSLHGLGGMKSGPLVSAPFRDSLRKNLALDKAFSDEDLLFAMHLFELTDELSDLNIDLDTDLSTWSKKLSLGQRQRLQLTRLYLHGNRKILDIDMFAIESKARSAILQNLREVAHA